MEKEILQLFAFDESLTFTQIKNKLNAKSNSLAYWLKKLKKSSLLSKKDQFYSLTDSSENLVPYLSAQQSALPVILIHIGDSRHAFLYKRTKRPYKGLLSLPGGRILLGESPEQAAKRIMHAKFSIDLNSVKIKSVFLEHVRKKDKILYSFFLILISANSSEKIPLISVDKDRSKIIESDYQLIKCKNSKAQIKTIHSQFRN